MEAPEKVVDSETCEEKLVVLYQDDEFDPKKPEGGFGLIGFAKGTAEAKMMIRGFLGGRGYICNHDLAFMVYPNGEYILHIPFTEYYFKAVVIEVLS